MEHISSLNQLSASQITENLGIFTSMFNNYGVKWLSALHKLGAGDRNQALISLRSKGVANIEKHFLDNVSSDSSEIIIQQKLLSYGNRQFNVKTALPDKINAMGWQKVNLNSFPAGFRHTTKDVETDAVCIKHAVEELGTDPSVTKMNSYFAEMVDASMDTFDNWKHSGKPETHSYTVTKAIGRWTIKCKKVGKTCEIFHIDSGYGNSGWIA